MRAAPMARRLMYAKAHPRGIAVGTGRAAVALDLAQDGIRLGLRLGRRRSRPQPSGQLVVAVRDIVRIRLAQHAEKSLRRHEKAHQQRGWSR
jgi:hypothetical protein